MRAHARDVRRERTPGLLQYDTNWRSAGAEAATLIYLSIYRGGSPLRLCGLFLTLPAALAATAYGAAAPGQPHGRRPSSARREKTNLVNVSQIDSFLLLCFLAVPLRRKVFLPPPLRGTNTAL